MLIKNLQTNVSKDRQPLWRRAFLSSTTFSQILETLQGDTVSKARIRQVAMTVGVHGSTADLCVDFFVGGAVKAGLATTTSDDKYVLTTSGGLANPPALGDGQEEHAVENGSAQATLGSPAAVPQAAIKAPLKPSAPQPDGTGPKTGATLQLHVDSSSDPDKLRKQLELLREFGMI